tara:strand:+ start:1133 stop:1762 length:630 start_codon:yes stop_codon:yes gene_type:complete
MLFLTLTAFTSVIELTPQNWDTMVVDSGKHAFIKFYAPWCGHCKKLKPDWDRLGEDADDTVIIADVDCTADGKPLCEKYDIKGFPTLKSFWGKSSEDYKGGRSYNDLIQYANNLKIPCNIKNKNACTKEETEELEKLLKLSDEKRRETFEKIKKDIKIEEENHDNLLKKLQEKFETSKNNLEKLKEEHKFKINLLEQMVEKSEGAKDEL